MEDEEEGTLEIDFDIPLAQVLKRKRKLACKKRKLPATPDEPPADVDNPAPAQLPAAVEHPENDGPPQITVSEFDYSVENHFKAVDTISKLCGYPEALDVSQPEIERLSNSITFLREWRDFKYAPRVVKFASQRSPTEKDVVGGITLSQFSAAAVPKETQNGINVPGKKSSNDFVFHVGGAVWALDWCPRVESDFENHINCEFVAVAAHPPESSYHKIGAPLTGRGVVQIWCLLTACVNEDAPSLGNKKPKQKPQKKQTVKADDLDKPQRPRGRPRKETVKANELEKPRRPKGRPRKKPLTPVVEDIDYNSERIQPLAIEYPADSSKLHSSERTCGSANKHVSTEASQKTAKESNKTEHAEMVSLTASKGRKNKAKGQKKDQARNNGSHNLRYGDNDESPIVYPPASPNRGIDFMRSDQNVACTRSCDTSKYSIPEDFALPRMMLCLAHNGKVAWDVKWRPVGATKCMTNMGYLAVLLGNGALEVWEVPLPQTIKLVFPAWEDRVDPRFMKLKPVFRCSMLKCGDRQSVPLTVEWSASWPHDMILAGCHDGVVALWKFSITDSSTESRPLLSFSADTGPIRTLAWAPIRSDPEGANIIVTSGHRGFKFWDIRDPFRPLWDHPVPGVRSLDWLPDPSCIFGAIDDGTLWLLSLVKATCDIPVTGKPSPPPTKQGIHTFDCSSFSLWSIQASRLTGMVAYCGEDGTTLCFQLTTRSVNDPSRHRMHHYICGSLLEEEQGAITIVTPMTDSPFSKRDPSLKRGSGPDKSREKKAKEQIVKDQSQKKPPLALCYGNDPVDELESENMMDKQLQKSKEINKSNGDEGESDEGFEAFPPKVVAMHRVRWNVNKGSEKWLCYGGAAGLVRCQEVDLSVFW